MTELFTLIMEKRATKHRPFKYNKDMQPLQTADEYTKPYQDYIVIPEREPNPLAILWEGKA